MFGLGGRIVRSILGALVVLPTRELAVQVYDVFAALSPRLGLWTAVTAARVSLAAEAAALEESPPNVLVATPGRLMSHLKDARLSLSGLRFLVSACHTSISQLQSLMACLDPGRVCLPVPA